MPEFKLEGQELEVIEEIKLLGVKISSDLSWEANTQYITKRASISYGF